MIKIEKFAISRPVSYVILRVTGIALAFLALGHFFITHLVNDVSETGSEFISSRWSSILWIVWDSLLLVTCAAHIFSGAVIIIYDYATDIKKRSKLRLITNMAIFVFLLIGLSILGFALFDIYGRS